MLIESGIEVSWCGATDPVPVADDFPTLEEAAETLRREARAEGRALDAALIAHLESRGLTVEFADAETLDDAVRRFDPERRLLLMARSLPAATRCFQLAFQAALIDARAELDAVITEAKFANRESEQLARVGLANYLAGAVMMPYDAFLPTAKRLRYDMEALALRFGTSFEQACHRLTTLQRPGAKGVPFYLMRVDVAGNVSKRFSGAGFHFSRFGGSCPRWIVHQAFATPGQIRTQVARLPDGATFFAIARTLGRPRASYTEAATHLALSIGCDIGDAGELVYAEDWNLSAAGAITEIGIGCRLCERMECRQRAFPPLHHRLLVDDKIKGRSAYRFAAPAKPTAV